MGTLVSLVVMSFQGGAQFGYGNNPLIPPPSSSAPPPSHVSGPGPLGRDDEEVKLYSSSRERERIEALGDLYAIIQTVEVLEKAYIRDSVTADEYTPACSKLITQFKSARNLLRDVVPDIEHGAMHRDDASKSAQHVAEAVHYFITAMDTLKPNLAPDFEGKTKIKQWLTQLNQMSASDDLSDTQLRQLLFDLEQSYDAFHSALK